MTAICCWASSYQPGLSWQATWCQRGSSSASAPITLCPGQPPCTQYLLFFSLSKVKRDCMFATAAPSLESQQLCECLGSWGNKQRGEKEPKHQGKQERRHGAAKKDSLLLVQTKLVLQPKVAKKLLSYKSRRGASKARDAPHWWLDTGVCASGAGLALLSWAPRERAHQAPSVHL